MDWRLLQIADVAFPTGGFTLSGGLEAAAQLGEMGGEQDVDRFLRASLRQAARGALPLVERVRERPEAFAEANDLAQAFLNGPVANRASRLQGAAFLRACERAFGPDGFQEARAAAHPEAGLHFAPVFGYAAARLGFSGAEARQLFLFLVLRDLLSAAVRLGLLGPYQAQGLQARLAPELDRLLGEAVPPAPAQSMPLLDLFQAAHDGLGSRLFQA